MHLKIMLALYVFLMMNGLHAQTLEREIINQINKIRLAHGGAAKGLSPFVRNAALDSAALYHAKWVVASGIRSHVEDRIAGGIEPLPEFWNRAAKYGVTAYAENLIQYCNYEKNGDSIKVPQTAARVVSSWKNSPGHLTNMLFSAPSEIELGIGMAVVPYQDLYDFCVVMVVGAHADEIGTIHQPHTYLKR